MPVFEVPRKYVQIKRTQVRDSVYVQAADGKEARELVESGKYDDIAFMGEETGKHHEYGEIVSSIDAGDPELTDIDPDENTATN